MKTKKKLSRKILQFEELAKELAPASVFDTLTVLVDAHLIYCYYIEDGKVIVYHDPGIEISYFKNLDQEKYDKG